MSNDVANFVNTWVQENIHPTAYAPEDGDHPDSDRSVKELLAAATEEGITREQIEDDFGDLLAFMNSAYEDATDQEVQHLADKDD